MPNNPLYNVPFYGGYLARRDAQAQEGLSDIKKADALLTIKNKIDEQRTTQELQRITQGAGGNPKLAIDALLRAGTPKSIELAEKLKGLVEKPVTPQLVTVKGPDGKPMQRWVRPGENAGVDVGEKYVDPAAPKTPQLVTVLDENGKPMQKWITPGESSGVNVGIKPDTRPSTNVTVNTGPMGLGKSGENKVDESLLNTTAQLMRIDNIWSGFEPKFQKVGYRFKNTWNAIREKAGANLNESSKRDLAEFSAYKRGAIENINRYIKEITGAQMSEAEANRIRQGMPDPGESWWGGDSPTEFEAKLSSVVKELKLSVARLAYIKRNGMSLLDQGGNAVIPLSKMPEIINQRGTEIDKDVRRLHPDLPDAAVEKVVRRQLSIEFGLVEK